MDKKSNIYLNIIRLSESNLISKSDMKILLSQEEIASIFKKKSVYNDKFISELQPTDEKFFNIFFYCITKYPRSSLEISVIMKYLNNLEALVNLLKKSGCSIKELTFTIASSIKYESLKRDFILFRLGDKGEKYYIILKGAICILNAKDLKMDLTEDEYLKYIIKLKSSNEVELLYRTLIHNHQVFPTVYEKYYQKPIERTRGTTRHVSTRNSLNTKIIVNKDYDDVRESHQISVDDYINHNLPTQSARRH